MYFPNNYVRYLGHTIDNNPVRLLKDYLTAVKNFPVLETRINKPFLIL